MKTKKTNQEKIADHSGENHYFHLGMHKTASTYLQNVIFPQLNGVRFFRKSKFKQYKITGPEIKALFSHEEDIFLIQALHRLKADRPKANVFLIVREPSEWVVSKYKYYIRKHGYYNFKDFYEKIFLRRVENPKQFYSEGLSTADQLFENTLFLDFEWIKRDYTQLIKPILQFLKLDTNTHYKNKIVNQAFSLQQLTILRRFNAMYKYRKAQTKSKILNKIHYKYREFLLHIVAFFALFIPVKTKDFKTEIESMIPIIKWDLGEDWAFVKEHYLQKK